MRAIALRRFTVSGAGVDHHALAYLARVAGAGPRVPLAGWVANGIDPEAAKVQENINTLKSMLPAPCLGVIPHGPQADKEALAQLIDIDLLLQWPCI